MTETALRERKRLETWSALHESAAALAMARENLNCVTVDAIVDPVNVSARTFFNYFTTKEDAILGFSEPDVNDAALDAFLASPKQLLARVADFYFDVMQASRTGGIGRQRRIDIIERHPELTNRQITHYVHVEGLVRDTILEHLTDTDLPDGIGNHHELVDVLVLMSSTAYRLSVRRFTARSTESTDRGRMHDALTQLTEITR